jgi:dTDP-4-amino-4,6-dideoxygalactose transaminase
MGKEEVNAVARVVETGSLFRVNTETREVITFEKELAEKFGTEYALAVTSGTAALEAVLVAMGVGPGDEVIVPGYTFISTAIAVLNAGAIPVLCDVDETLTMCAADFECKITKRTKAVIPVHICGMPCDMDSIMAVAKKHNVLVLEDACQADGGSYKGKHLGTIGEAGTLSFNYYKIISAGEGGAILTNDTALFERALIFHDVGCPFWSYERKFSQEHFVGQQFRVSEITGAIMRVQLTRLDGILDDLRRIKKRIMAELDGRNGIAFAPSHDAEGDCSTQLAFRFDCPDKAKKFAEKIERGSLRPLDSDRHVFIYWYPILTKKGHYNEAMNPYNFPQNKGCTDNINKDGSPKTIDILGRTALIALNPDMTNDDISKLINDCLEVAKQM